jgi:hypothetical protein
LGINIRKYLRNFLGSEEMRRDFSAELIPKRSEFEIYRVAPMSGQKEKVRNDEMA